MLVDGVYSADEGRPSYPPLMMVKVLRWSSGTTFPTRRWRRQETAYRSVDSWAWDFRTTPDYSTISRSDGLSKRSE